MSSELSDVQHFIHGGRFLKVEGARNLPEKRSCPDRRKNLRGDPAKSETGVECRVGSRRLEDVIITIEIRDPKRVYVNDETLKKFLIKNLQREFSAICADSSVDSLLNFIEKPDKILMETKLKYRDKVKKFAALKGLSFEVIDNGVYLGGFKDQSDEAESPKQAVDGLQDYPEASELSTIMGFPPDKLEHEIENIIFKMFVKCLNEVHPISRENELEALKQNVSVEQKIIFLASEHYTESKKNTDKTILEEVFSEDIKEYNKMIQLEVELHKLEERYQLLKDDQLKTVIQAKQEELDHMWDSSLEATIRTLYLYLDYFKEIIKVGLTRERIENIFKKVNEKQIEVLNLQEIYQKTQEILKIEGKIKQQNSEKIAEYLGYFKWLKNEITNEVYFTRHLWINNMKGKAYIDNAIERTLRAVGEQ